MDERAILTERQTGLHVGWYFWLRLLDEVGRSDRYGSSFGLALLDVVAPKGAARRAVIEALARLPRVVRGTDLAGLVGPSRAGILLPEQEPESAEVGLGRIVAQLQAGAPHGITWAARLFCYPRDAAGVTHLLSARSSERASA